MNKPDINKPGKLENPRQLSIYVDQPTIDSLNITAGYLANLLGVRLSFGGVVRRALFEYRRFIEDKLQKLEAAEVGTKDVKGTKGSNPNTAGWTLETERAKCIEVNKINPERVRTKAVKSLTKGQRITPS